MIANTGFLFVSNVSKINSMYLQACSFVKKVLYIKVYDNMKYATPLPLLSQQIVNIYSKSFKDCKNMDIRLMLDTKKNDCIHTNLPVDLVMCDNDLIIKGRNLSKTIASLSEVFKETIICSYDTVPDVTCLEDIKTYENVVVGGVFDRLHNGHKILLSEAALRATNKLIVAVTDAEMLQNKILWELIEPVEKRKEAVTNFLTDIKPDLVYDVVSVTDTYGPTISDPDLKMIVVSEETNWGADKINEYRQKCDLDKLERHIVNLIQDNTLDKDKREEPKVSSCNERIRILGTMIKQPEPKPEIPDPPYVVGIAGGIASGKTTVANMLEEKGVAIVNCDSIADEMFQPGLMLNIETSNILGDEVILKPTGEIDRRIFGQIVYNDPDKLQQIQRHVWPTVFEEVRQQIGAFRAEGYSIVALESSYMLLAEWYKNCHQLWVVITPFDEAVARAMECYSLSEVEAKEMVTRHPSNSEYVALANCVLSTQWTYGFLQKQIDKAWLELKKCVKSTEVGTQSS